MMNQIKYKINNQLSWIFSIVIHFFMRMYSPFSKNRNSFELSYLLNNKKHKGLFQHIGIAFLLICFISFSISLKGQVNGASLNPLSPGPLCQNTVVIVDFTMVAGSANESNDIQLFLSDLNNPGTFSNPAVTSQPSGLPGNILWTIPSNLAPGTYNFRVNSDIPTGSASTASFTVLARTITPTYPVATSYNVGNPISVPFTILPSNCSFNAGNTYILEISNASGNFASATTIASLSSTGGGTLSGNIPSLPYGTGYRLRIRSTNPVVISAMSNAFTINPRLTSTACVCNNNQTPNNQNGTFAATLIIRNEDNSPMASGLSFQMVVAGTSGLFNTSGGPLGTASFVFCDGTGCPSGVVNGQYYLNVHVQNSGEYTANVDGPDPDSNTDYTLSTNCAISYPPLPIIEMPDLVCITKDTTFPSGGHTFNRFNTLSPINFRPGFSQTGTGPLMVNYENFDPDSHNPYDIYLIAQNSSGCRVSSYKPVEIYRRPIATIVPRYYGCRELGRTINLFEMFDVDTWGTGTFFLDGVTELASGSYTITGPVCQSVTYRIVDPKCGTIQSTATFRVDILPKPAFDLTADNPSPVCMDGGTVSVSVSRTSTGPNPVWTINGTTATGTTFNLNAPTAKGSITYNICLAETSVVSPTSCGAVTLPANAADCTAEFCRRYTVYNDGFACGANNLFTNQCVVPRRDVCTAEPYPRLVLACGSIFSIEIPFDILTTRVTMDQEVIDCTDAEVCGNFNASLFGIEVPGGGGPRVEDIPGISSLCKFFNTCIDVIVTDICPFKFLYNLLMCNKSILSIIFDALAALVGGSGGDWILVADTDGDGSFDYMINADDDTNAASGFPSNGDFCIPNNLRGAGTITVRLVAAWPNKPTAVCGPIVSDGINLLDLIPIGAIPIAGPIIEDILAAAGCNIELAFSNFTDAEITVLSTTPPIFANCNTAGYVFQQELSCNIPVNWTVPLAIIPCEMTTLAYKGVTEDVDLSFYQGINPPVPFPSITEEGIYQTAGPVPGSILPPGVYPITYTAVSCNGNPSQCTFNVIVTQDVPGLVSPNNITISTDVGQCTAFVNGLAPYRGLGGCSSILNYSFTDPVSGTINETDSTIPGSINVPDGHRFELGTTTITYTLLNDNNGDGDYEDENETQVSTFTITVTDNQKPVAVCTDVVVRLDNTGSAIVYADQVAGQIFIDGGCNDNCDDLELEISKDGLLWTETLTFDCSDEGPNYIRLRATDLSGNERICFAFVYVEDFFTDFVLNLDVPEICFEPFQNSYDFSRYLVIATPDGTNIRHADVGTLGPDVVGTFGISGFLPDPGSTFDPGTISPDGIYTLGSGTGWITISYVLSITGQINSIDGGPLTGCFKMVHDIYRVQRLDPVWQGGFMCCDQLPVWLGGAGWNGTGTPPVPAGMLSLTDIRATYPKDAYGEWTGQGVSFVNPDGLPFTGDEFYQFNPNGLDGTYTLTYIIGDEPCIFTWAQDIRVTCQDLQIALSDITVCPANWVDERVVIVNLDDKDLVVSSTGFSALAADGAHYGLGPAVNPVMDLVDVPVVDGRVVIPGFYAPAVRNKDYEICIITYQTTPFGCADVFCYTITVQDLEAPDFRNCPKEPIVVDAPAGWCSAFVNFEFPWAFDNCMGLYSRIRQVDTTGLKSGSLFPVGTTILAYTAIDTVGNQNYCEIKIIVNDFHTPPSVVCPANRDVVNDPDKCGAVVNNIAPISYEDNCPDNLTVLYEITDADGNIVGCGFEDASGSFFPVGTSTVKYKVLDQPLILITEVVQNGLVTGIEITNFGPAAVDITCSKFIVKNQAGEILEMFTVPSNNNISTLFDKPIYPPVDPIIWNINTPDNILQVGETYTHIFNGDQDGDGDIDVVNNFGRCDQLRYCFAFLERVIDEAWTNDQVVGDVILRKNVCDTDTQTDFIPATPCDPGSFGMLNPGLPTMTPNGTQTSLQNYAPSMRMCSFTVKVSDIEAPTCIWHDTIPKITLVTPLPIPVNLVPGQCLIATVTMPAGIIDDVNIYNFKVTTPNAGSITAYLRGPSGTRIKLFDRVCATDIDYCDGDGLSGSPNVDVNLDETIKWIPAPSIVNAVCAPALGAGGIYRPEESFKAFYGEQGGGVWTLEIFTDEGTPATLTDWDLQILYRIPFAQPDVVLENAPGLCTQDFTWIHPILEDNCCKGKMDVKYTFVNDVTGEMSEETGVISNINGTIKFEGCEITKTFKVGKTTVEYTLQDQYGNLNTCGFMVTVLDTEKPVFLAPFCPNRVINLAPGECYGVLNNPPDAEDNCGMKGVTFCFEDGTMADINRLPIGVYNLIAKAEDIYGNIETCTFQVSVVEFIPPTNILTCNNHLNISLDANCEAVLTADMILEGGPYRCYENYCIEIRTLSGVLHPNLFTIADEGKTFNVSIIDCNGPQPANSCWGTVTIEEKLLPVFRCPADLTLACNIDVEARHPVTGKLLTGEAELLSCEVGANINYQDEWISYGQCNNPRALVRRIWTIIDSEGNKVECIQDLTIRALDLDDVVYPADLDFNKAIECSDAAYDPTLVSPAKTGYPMLNGVQVNKAGGLCMVSLNYSDELYDICDGSYEILRYWRVRNMCLPVSATNPRTHVQVIKVLDTKGPIVKDCPADITMSVNPWSCRAFGNLHVPLTIEELCSEDFTFRAIIYGGGRIHAVKSSDGKISASVSDLTPGTYRVVYSFKDDCANKSECSFMIYVKDLVAPFAIAKRDVVISLTPGYDENGVEDGQAKLFAESIDNGSFDNCTPVRLEIRRASNAPSCGNFGVDGYNNNVTYSDSPVPLIHNDAKDSDKGAFVKFCCEDINAILVDANGDGAVNELDRGYHEVILRVWDDGNRNGIIGDAGDNWSEIWSYVKVESKSPPVITCPPDATIYCDWAIPTNVSSTFAPANPDDFEKMGFPSAYAVCGDIPVTYRDQRMQWTDCNTGWLQRTFRITQKVNGVDVTRECTQRIDVLNSPLAQPWEMVFPADWAVTKDAPCTGPDSTMIRNNRPGWIAGPCDVIGVSTKMWQFDFEDGVCRKWKVEYKYVNWCTGEEKGPFEKYFVFRDVVAPTFANCRDTMYAVGADCKLPGLVITKRANDTGGCPGVDGWLKWEVFIDLWADGGNDYLFSSFVPNAPPYTSTGVIQLINGQSVRTFYTAPTGVGGLKSITIPEVIEGKMSNHKVAWKVTDGCHNFATCHEEFMVVDKKPPTPYCVSLSTALMAVPQGAPAGTRPMVELWAIDFDKGSFDGDLTWPCTPQSDLLFTFDTIAPVLSLVDVPHFFKGGATATTSVVATADEYNAGNAQRWMPSARSSARVWTDRDLDEGSNKADVQVKMSVWDKKLNTDFCWTNLKLICTSCPGGLVSNISGNTRTAFDQGVSNVQITVEAQIPEFPRTHMTDVQGVFSIELLNDLDYQLSAQKHTDYLDGVSTLDLVLIQRHLLGMEPLGNMYQLIAADANNNGRVTAADLTELRKLILGVTHELPGQSSWRFPVKNQVLDPVNPFPYEERINISPLLDHTENQDFVAVKIGDVNGNATVNIDNPAIEARSNKSLTLYLLESEIEAGTITQIPVRGSNYKDVFGYQFTLLLDGATYAGIRSGNLDISEANVGNISGDRITVSYAAVNAESYGEDDVLFTLLVRAAKAGTVSNLLRLSSEITKAEAYLNQEMLVSNIDLEVRNSDKQTPFVELYQNEPNPFRGVTTIAYLLPEAAKAKITVYDATGRILAVRDTDAIKGINNVVFTQTEIGAAGVYYYKLETGDFTGVKKMILVE
jgi:hypothetical protein